MPNLLHVSKEPLHIFILSMAWENYPRFFLSFQFIFALFTWFFLKF